MRLTKPRIAPVPDDKFTPDQTELLAVDDQERPRC